MLQLQILIGTFVLLANSVSETAAQARFSYSGEFGSAAGTSFSYSGDHFWGPITAFRVWEQPSGYIKALQFQFAGTWSKTYGYEEGKHHEVTLFHGEEITQISGKHSTYIYQLIFFTNYRRTFFFGQPAGESFNAFPLEQGNVLAFITGHHNGAGITGIGMHWDQSTLPALKSYAQIPEVGNSSG
ncbi:zymogen granule membrane protein 16-like [Trachemys scripta elegans]|uniref:zymogen granule membrane protein 16-like n=1 Tax=Trachemys scripta elegans TaxID=31138 RepID=UPI001552B76F|nr:zymogen granule membrane protein 16-like [Trachemys scripta elegans]